jgi:hypothetical protein
MKNICKLDECENYCYGQGYCNKHYRKFVTGYDYFKKKRIIRRDFYKQQLLTKFGSKCRCCNESNTKFLTIDHINNNGAEHRRGKNGNRRDYLAVWKEILETGTNENFQTLCMNCNWAKNLYGKCPHMEEK